MRIAIFTETYLPDINGVATHIETLKLGFEKLGHEVIVVAADKNARRHYIHDGVLHCPSLESKKFYGFGVALPLSKRRLALVKSFNPDIIHIHHEFGVGISGIMIAKKLGLPLVYTLHTMYDEYVHYIAPERFKNSAVKITHLIMSRIARKADVLVGPSRKCEAYFKKIGIQTDFFLIPNSADTTAFLQTNYTDAQRGDLRASLEISPDKTIACFVGRIGKEKRVEVLIDYFSKACEKSDKIHLLIIGEGPEKESLEERVQSLGIADHVTFTGRVEHKDIPIYFGICDAYATASLSEMNSISMLEGMAAGLPILQYYDELNAEQIKVGVNGYHYETAEEFSKHLLDIANQSSAEKTETKAAVVASISDRDSVGLAKRMMIPYEKAFINHAVQNSVLQRG